MFPEICMVGAKVIQFSAKYFGACFELLTKCGWIKPLYCQALAKTVAAPKILFLGPCPNLSQLRLFPFVTPVKP